MLEIKIYNTYSYLIGDIPIEIYDVCTLSQTYFYRNKAKEIKVKERKTCYFSKRYNSFPTGWLFSKIIPTLKKLDIYYLLTDYRQEYNDISKINGKYPFELRSYQNECIDMITINKKIRGIISIGTGGGKSIIAGKIIDYYGRKTLYIVPSLLLLNQTYKNFCDWFGIDKVGYIGNGEYNVSLINVATAQTIWARLETPEIKELLETTEVLFLDEAHRIQKPNSKTHFPGNTWYLIAMKVINAKIRIGLTATPGKENSYSRELLEGVTGKIIFERTLSWLMENGYLSKLTVFISKNKIETNLTTWEESYKENILQNEKRNKKIVEFANKLANEGKRILIIVNRIEEHGDILLKLLGNKAESLYGEDTSLERKDILKRFINKDTKIIISTVIKEGVDLPEMDAIILASAGKGGDFGRDLLQKLGRVVRKTDEKIRATLIDFFDDDGYVFFNEKKKPNILLRHSLQRLNIYKKQTQFEIKFIGE